MSIRNNKDNLKTKVWLCKKLLLSLQINNKKIAFRVRKYTTRLKTFRYLMQTIRLVKAKAETLKCELPPSIILIWYLCTRSRQAAISVKIHRNGVQILQLVFKAPQFVYYTCLCSCKEEGNKLDDYLSNFIHHCYALTIQGTLHSIKSAVSTSNSSQFKLHKSQFILTAISS